MSVSSTLVHGPTQTVRLVDEWQRIRDTATARGVHIRLTGSVAVRLHCPEKGDLFVQLEREGLRDLDFATYSSESSTLTAMLEEMGYELDPTIRQQLEWGVKRLIFRHPKTAMKLDFFLDELRMSHLLSYVDRLQLDDPTVPLSDLLLSKLQVHEITQNDLKDILVLLAEHPLGDQTSHTVDIRHILGHVRDHWGLSHTTLCNLERARRLLAESALGQDDKKLIHERLLDLTQRIEAAPKSLRWRARAKLGTRVQWYEDVEDVDR